MEERKEFFKRNNVINGVKNQKNEIQSRRNRTNDNQPFQERFHEKI